MFGKTIVRPCERASAVIIKFNDKRSVSEMQLPIGMDLFPQSDYGLKKQLFFKTYQTYRKFIAEKSAAIEKIKTASEKTLIDQDTVIESQSEYLFQNSQTGESISYQKLVMFDSILNAYDELKIQSLQSKLSKTEEIDYSKMHRYLHNAVYLSNGAVYIDLMDTPKHILKDASTELVEMFAYIYSEIMKELDQEPSNAYIQPLANFFKERRLFEESSLFSEDTYEDTISILKEVLQEIDTTTVYKDYDYWHFYDAIYHFLYSDNNGEWVLDNFSFIWERMCLAYAQKYHREQISVYDNFGRLTAPNKNSVVFPSYFLVRLNAPQNVVRYIRPDLVMEEHNFSIQESFIETLYEVEIKGTTVNIIRKSDVDYRQWGEIEGLKLQLFKSKPRIHSFFQRTGKYPRTFTVNEGEFLDFKNRSKELLLHQRSCFELASRTPNILGKIDINGNNEFLVVDYKYMTEQAFQLPVSNSVQNSITKQYVYELALKLNRNADTRSEFWIPGFLFNKDNRFKGAVRRYSRNCDSFFKNYRVSVIQMDFLALQTIYVSDDFTQ